MNYEANKTQWKRGDIVIHDADAKETYMLMVVQGYDRKGRCITRYLKPDGLRPGFPGGKEYHNPVTALHNPRRFGLVPWGDYGAWKKAEGGAS